MTKFKLTLGIGFIGAIHEDEISIEDMGYTQEQWDELDKADQDDELQQYWIDWSGDYIAGGWEEIKE